MNDSTCSARELLKKPYARVLVPGEDGRYSAEFLEFPGCYACGNTPGEAIDNLEKAGESWIDATLEQKQEIPEPLASYGYSGKINLRLPKSIHKQAARFAQRDDVSLNQFFTSAIATRVGVEDFCDRLVKRLEAHWAPYASVAIFQQNLSCVMFFADASGLASDMKYISVSSPWMVIPSPNIVPVPIITEEKKSQGIIGDA